MDIKDLCYVLPDFDHARGFAARAIEAWEQAFALTLETELDKADLVYDTSDPEDAPTVRPYRDDDDDNEAVFAVSWYVLRPCEAQGRRQGVILDGAWSTDPILATDAGRNVKAAHDAIDAAWSVAGKAADAELAELADDDQADDDDDDDQADDAEAAELEEAHPQSAAPDPIWDRYVELRAAAAQAVETDDAPTIQPVTAPGFYALTNGKIAHIEWHDGRPITLAIFATWADVAAVEAAFEAVIASVRP